MIPTTRKSASFNQYIKIHTENLHKQSPGSVYDFNTISITIVEFYKDNLYYLRDIIYMSLDESYKKYILEHCDKYPSPYDNLSVVQIDLLKERIMLKIKYRELNIKDSYNINDIDQYFDKFCEEKYDLDELIYLENTLHVDDHLLSDWHVPSEFNLREKALNLIQSSEVGSWLVRRSSVTEQPNIKIRVITFKSLEEIRHYLFAQIDGFGYILTSGFSGDSFPKIGENKPLFISHVFRSLPSLLTFMKNDGLLLDKIVKS
jgi:hypothetical protein